jgi:hypothetical protein
VHRGIILQLFIRSVEKVFYGARHVPKVFGGADYESAAAPYILRDSPRHFLGVARLRMEHNEYVCHTE